MTSARSFKIETPPNAGFVFRVKNFSGVAAAAPKSISIIVPTLNEAENVAPLVEQILASGIAPCEIIFVDDGSTDGTIARLRQLAENFPVKLLLRDRPTLGLAGAVLAGARATAGELVVVMDADLGHPPNRLPDLVRPLQAGACDMVIGDPLRPRREHVRPAAFAKNFIAGGGGVCLPAHTRARFNLRIFAISRAQLLALAPRASGFKIAFEILVRAGHDFRVEEIPIVFHDRVRGQSKMTLRVVLIFVTRWFSAIVRR